MFVCLFVFMGRRRNFLHLSELSLHHSTVRSLQQSLFFKLPCTPFRSASLPWARVALVHSTELTARNRAQCMDQYTVVHFTYFIQHGVTLVAPLHFFRLQDTLQYIMTALLISQYYSSSQSLNCIQRVLASSTVLI